MDDFVWIENELSEANACKKHLERNSGIGAESVNIAQHGTNSESSGIIEEILPEYDAEDTSETLVDQQYWEHHAAVTKRESSSRKKYLASQRLTIRQLDNIANFNKIVRNPSYFKLGRATTATLETLIAKKYVGPLHNVVSEGKRTVIIHADLPDTSGVPIWFLGGNTVKIYKLTNDVKENIVIHKRAQKEYEHLLLLRHYQNIPYVVHRMKNVLILRGIGNIQETAHSITQLPSEYFNGVYQIIVNDMDMWYTKSNIVHGNLCTKNFLFVHVKKQDSKYKYPFLLYTVGWGHSVKRDNPRALMKLIKDCYFITNFFGRRGVTVRSTEELFKHITGLEKISAKVLDVIHKKDLWQDGHLTNPNR